MTTKAQKAAAEAKAKEAGAAEGAAGSEEMTTIDASRIAILAPFDELIGDYQSGDMTLDAFKSAIEEPAEVTVGEDQFDISAITLELRDGQRLHIRRKQVLGEFIVAEARLSPG